MTTSDFFVNKWEMELEMSDYQPTQAEGQTLKFSFRIWGQWKIFFRPTHDVIAVSTVPPDRRCFIRSHHGRPL